MVKLDLFQYTLFSLNSQNLFMMFSEDLLYNQKEHNVLGKKHAQWQKYTFAFSDNKNNSDKLKLS